MNRLAVPVAVVLLFAATAMPAAAADPSYGFTNVFDWRTPLGNTQTFVVYGSAAATGGCSFVYPEMHITTDETWLMRVLATDLVGCRQLVEQGTADGPLPMPTGNGYANSTEQTLGPGAPQNGPAAVTTSGRKLGIHTAQWVDPALVAVNWVDNELTWAYDGDCAYLNSDVGKSDWLWETNWSRTFWSLTNSQALNCQSWLGQSKATFKNTVFCDPNADTWAFYDYVRVRGWADGTATFTHSSNVQGDCANLLHFETSSSLKSV
jgi:hypothetical protein